MDPSEPNDAGSGSGAPQAGNPEAPTSTVIAQLAPLAELFAKDPLELTDAEIDTIVIAMRAKRNLWAQAEATASPRAKPRKAAEITVAPPSLDLGDLGI